MATFTAAVPLSIYFVHEASGTIQEIDTDENEEFIIADSDAAAAFLAAFGEHDQADKERTIWYTEAEAATYDAYRNPGETRRVIWRGQAPTLTRRVGRIAGLTEVV